MNCEDLLYLDFIDAPHSVMLLYMIHTACCSCTCISPPQPPLVDSTLCFVFLLNISANDIKILAGRLYCFLGVANCDGRILLLFSVAFVASFVTQGTARLSDFKLVLFADTNHFAFFLHSSPFLNLSPSRRRSSAPPALQHSSWRRAK